MPSYKCKDCSKYFDHKGTYERHINRKNKCTQCDNSNLKTSNFTCDECDKHFTRKDSLKRHLKVCSIHNTKINKYLDKKINNIAGNDQIIKNHSDNIVINNYNLIPFTKDDINALTTKEKLALFSSNKNPMEQITLDINLNPDRPQNHNVGCTDLHSGFGIYFNGERWLEERINVIIEQLMTSKEKDLSIVRNHIRDLLNDSAQKEIDTIMDDLQKTLCPVDKFREKAKKILASHLKKHLYNYRQYAIDAKKNYTVKKSTDNDDEAYKKMLREGVTIEYADKYIQKIIKDEPKVNFKKDMAKYLLRSLYKKDKTITNYSLIVDRIENARRLEEINAICKMVLIKNLNLDEINKKIDNNIEIEKYVFDFTY